MSGIMSKTAKTLRRLKRLPPRLWQKVTETIDRLTLVGVETALNDEIANLVMLTSYLGAINMGTDHDKAVKTANTVRRNVRKALGYHTTHDIMF